LVCSDIRDEFWSGLIKPTDAYICCFTGLSLLYNFISLKNLCTDSVLNLLDVMWKFCTVTNNWSTGSEVEMGGACTYTCAHTQGSIVFSWVYFLSLSKVNRQVTKENECPRSTITNLSLCHLSTCSQAEQWIVLPVNAVFFWFICSRIKMYHTEFEN
jgi:hypothetical protein